jgi:hypothetical protein
MRETGRNDPCPCGSGKKYKHCCRRLNQAQEESPTAHKYRPEDLARLGDQIRASMAGALPEKAERGAQLLAELDDLAGLPGRWEEIEAAEETLGAHRPEYEALLADCQALREHVERLFAEEAFHPLRFSMSEMQSAFEAEGFLYVTDELAAEVPVIRALLKRLAGEEYRQRAAIRLMLLLPQYVAAGRHLDAALIQDCACRLLEQPEESNPFLAAMFMDGLQRWAEHTRAAKEETLEVMGLSEEQLRAMAPEEAGEWVRAQGADPARLAQLEAHYDRHPELAAQARADLEAAELGVIALLERGEAQALLLPPEEVEPWAHLAAERMDPLLHRWPKSLKGKLRRRPPVKQLQDALLQVAQEMVPAVFTRERLRRYTWEAQEYARILEDAGRRQAARHVRMAMLPLGLATEQAESRLLPIIAYASLVGYLKAQQEALYKSAAGG